MWQFTPLSGFTRCRLKSVQQATDRMSEAIVLHVERDFHVKDYVREPGEKAGKGSRLICGLLQDGLSLL